jgi:hypothetical protein
MWTDVAAAEGSDLTRCRITCRRISFGPSAPHLNTPLAAHLAYQREAPGSAGEAAEV